MSDPQFLTTLVPLAGFGVAFVLGAVSMRTHFCTLGAVADIVSMNDWTRMRMWVLAMAVAILGAQALDLSGQIALADAVFVRPNLTWLSAVVGGLMFGVGMTLASGCGSRTLVRAGGGNLKSLVVLVFLGLSAYMTMRGLFAVWRVNSVDRVSLDLAAHGLASQTISAVLASSGIAPSVARVAACLGVAGAMLVFVLKSADFRANKAAWLGGFSYGLAVVIGWYITAHLGYAENPQTLEMDYFATNSHRAESLTFIAPVAYTLELLMLWSDTSRILTFGIATAVGTFAGALCAALASGQFRWEGFVSIADTRNHIVGAVLMGVGGVTALGCTIGQGLTGVSTLAVGSFLAVGSMILGSWLTLRSQLARLMRDA